MRNKYLLALIIAFSLSILYRLYPFIYSGLPFSIDSWPLIRDTELLIKYSPIPLDNKIFDGYNNYWPGIILFSSVYSIVAHIMPIKAMGFIIPFIDSTSLLFIYIILNRLKFDKVVSISSVFLIGLSYPFSFFSAGVKKETYAITLYILIIFLITLKSDYKKYILTALLVSTLVLTHHLTLFVLAVIMFFISIYMLIKYDIEKVKYTFYTFSIIILFGAIHYYTFGFRGLRIPPIDVNMVISFLSYIIVFTFIGIYLSREEINKHRNNYKSKIMVSSIFSFSLAYFIIVMGYNDIAIKLPIEYLFYASPYIILGSLLAYGSRYISKYKERRILLFWFLAVSMLLTYSLFGDNPVLSNIPYRIADFFIIPLVIIGLTILSNARNKRIIVGAFLISLLAIPSIYASYSAYYQYDKFLGYNWRSRKCFNIVGEWLKNYNLNYTISGDTTVKYIYQGYYRMKYTSGSKYLNGKISTKTIFIFYDIMLKNGYNSGPYNTIYINKKIFDYRNNLIFNNLNIWIYESI